MSFPLPFSPAPGSDGNGSTVKITANATPTSVSGNLNAKSSGATRCRVFNNGTVTVFVRLSTAASPTATAADLPLGAGQAIILDANGAVAAAALSSTTTQCDVYFTLGEGGA